MNNTIKGSSPPLYVRIPQELHDYLDLLKEETGISKSDSVTLILYIAQRLIGPKTMTEMFDEYMLNGDPLGLIENLSEKSSAA